MVGGSGISRHGVRTAPSSQHCFATRSSDAACHTCRLRLLQGGAGIHPRSDLALGRKGFLTFLYDVIIALVIIALFAYIAFTYVGSRATGELYFSKFYAKDLATTADVVNAADGDVNLRYDNLKPGMELAYGFSNKRVTVNPYGGAAEKLKNIPGSSVIAGLGTTEFYATAQHYEGESMLSMPELIMLRKSNGAFGFTAVDIVEESCPVIRPSVEYSEAVIYVDLQGRTKDEVDKFKQTFRKALAKTSISIIEDQSKANVIFKINLQNGQKNELVYSEANADGRALACFFTQQLNALTIASFATSTPQATSSTFKLTATLTKQQDTLLTDDQIAQALARSLILLYGGTS